MSTHTHTYVCPANHHFDDIIPQPIFRFPPHKHITALSPTWNGFCCHFGAVRDHEGNVSTAPFYFEESLWGQCAMRSLLSAVNERFSIHFLLCDCYHYYYCYGSLPQAICDVVVVTRALSLGGAVIPKRQSSSNPACYGKPFQRFVFVFYFVFVCLFFCRFKVHVLVHSVLTSETIQSTSIMTILLVSCFNYYIHYWPTTSNLTSKLLWCTSVITLLGQLA